MVFEPRTELTKEELDSGLDYVIRDGVASQTMATLTGGVFLVAFALALGASNFMIGLIAAIPPLMQLIQLPSTYLVERFKNRKKLSVISSLISRLALIAIILIPFFFKLRAGLFVLIIALSLHAAFAAVLGCSWNTWMRDLIPDKTLSPFFAKRMAKTTTFELIISLAGGFFIDYWITSFPDHTIYGYSILFSMALFAGFLSIYYLIKTPEPKMNYIQKNLHLFQKLTDPLKNINYKNMVIFLGASNFAINLAAPFFTVYLLKRLGYPVIYAIAFQILTQLINVIFFRIWGRFSEHHSNKTILKISTPLFMFSVLAWTFTTLPEKHSFTIPLLIIIHIVMGATLAGIRLGSGNITFKLSPKEESIYYLATASFVNSTAAGIAPLLGGIFADFFANRQLSLTFSWVAPDSVFAFNTFSLQYWDFFFFIAFFIGLYSVHRLSKIEEEGRSTKKEQLTRLFTEIRKEMRNLSTLAGLRPMIKFPVLIMTTMRKKKKK